MQSKALCVCLLLLGGCASTGLDERLTAIDERPYIADSIEVKPYDSVKLTPLIKMEDLSQASFLRRHEQHKLDRLTVNSLDAALAAQSLQVSLLRDAMKNIEIADRATLRSNERLKDALEHERKMATFNDIKHTFFEVLLGILLIVK